MQSARQGANKACTFVNRFPLACTRTLTHHAPMFQPIKSNGPLTFLSVTALIAALAGSALAAPEAEHEALARIVHELQVLEPMIAEAEAEAMPGNGITFRYDWLRRDLARIRDGLQDHLDAAREAPRSFTPLRGDYRR